TVLISSHNLEELERLCDGAAILDHGRLVQAGSMSELTGAAVGFQVELVPGSDIPLAEILAVPGVQEAVVDPNWQLRVRHTPVEPTVEVVVAGVVRVLLDAGVGFRSISRGQRLEARVLEVTCERALPASPPPLLPGAAPAAVPGPPLTPVLHR